MKKIARVFSLEAGEHQDIRRLVCDRVDARSLAENKSVTLTVTRTGKFYDPRYGEFEITKDMLLSMVTNFDSNVYGQRIVLDVSHKPANGAAGFIKRLFVERGHKLRAEVELTEYGTDAIKKKGFIYVSAEFNENFVDNEKRLSHGPTLLGAGLTPRPVIKHLDPIQLSEYHDDDPPVYISGKVARLLSEDMKTMDKLLAELKKKLLSLTLAEKLVIQLCDSFKQVATDLATDDMRRSLMEGYIEQGEALVKQLAEAGANSTIQLSVSAPGGIDEDGLNKILAEREAAEKEAAKKLADSRDAKLKIFNDAIDNAESLKTLSEQEISDLKQAADLITADMSDAQVTKLAENQIVIGNRLSATKQLSGLGFNAPGGSVQVSVDETNNVKSLQEHILTGLRGTSQHTNGKLKLSEKSSAFVDSVLANFDAIHMPKLLAESKALAGGTTGIGDSSLPVGFQRTVIREALSDLRVLELVQTLTDPGATATTQIPYETRDISSIQNDGVVFEGQGIHRGSIKQEMDLAYIKPMKIAFLISEEVMHFSAASGIDWNAYSRNVESNARFIRELIVRRICNEMQRMADSFGALTVTAEDMKPQLDGTTVSVYKTASFPIVRPHQEKDLKGTNIGSVSNPITVQIDGAAIGEYDGTGTQSAGTYYRVTNYNLGYVQFVDQTGSPVTPADGVGATDISYDYASNVAHFDLDIGSTELGVHLNGLLRAIGARKALMQGDRFVSPDYLLMSPVLNDTCTNANNFEADSKRNGSDTSNTGDLETVKGVSSFSTNAPSVDLGDERILMGQAGTCAYTIAKPFMTKEPFEAVDGSGNPTGQLQAYGTEFSAIKVPSALADRMTSVIVYSFTNR